LPSPGVGLRAGLRVYRSTLALSEHLHFALVPVDVFPVEPVQIEITVDKVKPFPAKPAEWRREK